MTWPSIDAWFETIPQIATTIVVACIAYKAGRRAALQSTCVDLRRSLMAHLADFHDMILAGYIEATGNPREHSMTRPQSIARVRFLWNAVLLDLDLVRTRWKPKRGNANDKQIDDYTRLVSNYCGGAGRWEDLEFIPRVLLDEVRTWPLPTR